MAWVELPGRVTGLVPVPVSGVVELTSFTSGDGTIAIAMVLQNPVRRSVQINLSPASAGMLADFLRQAIIETESSLKVAAGCLGR